MKPKVKKVLKIVAPTMAIGLAISGVIVLSSGIIHNVSTVSIGGSTAVLPLINDIANHLNYIDIVTSAGGSGVGINSIINGSKEIGMSSKNPQIDKWKDNQLDEYKYNVWENKKVKTLTIAWDGIGIIYKPTKQSMNEDLNINATTLGKIYSAFSGFKEITFGDLFNNGDTKVITPYARNGGGDVSGTTEAFLLESNVEWGGPDISPQDKKIIINNIQKGNYGSHVRQTSEANSQAWANVKNGPEGSMIYLSSGFIINNKKEIEKYGFKIAKYDGKEMTIETIAKGYNWFRPFNLIYSMDHVKNKLEILQMFEDIIFNNKIHNEIMIPNGFTPLSPQQIKTLFNPNIDIDKIQDKKSLFIDESNTDIALTYSGAKPPIEQVRNDTRI